MKVVQGTKYRSRDGPEAEDGSNDGDTSEPKEFQ